MPEVELYGDFSSVNIRDFYGIIKKEHLTESIFNRLHGAKETCAYNNIAKER